MILLLWTTTRLKGVGKMESDFSWRCTNIEQEATSTNWNTEKSECYKWKGFYCESGKTLEQVVPRCCGISVPRNIQKPTRRGSEQTLTLLWAGELDERPPGGVLWPAWFSPLVSEDLPCSHSSNNMIWKFSTGSQAFQQLRKKQHMTLEQNICLELSNPSGLHAYKDTIPTNAPL